MLLTSRVALPWDIAILLLLCGGVWLGMYALRRSRDVAIPSLRKQFFTLSALSFLFTFVIAYGSFVEPQLIVTTEHEVVLPGTEKVTMVLLSDFHVGPYKGRGYVERVVERVNELQPDFVFIVGDFILAGSEPLTMFAPLQNLRPRYGTFAVLGNHDYGCGRMVLPLLPDPHLSDRSFQVQRTLERPGITVLKNSWKEVKGEAGSFFISGTDDACTRRARIEDTLPIAGKDSPLILLSHDPSIILETQAKRPHLILSGHTHGGQIRLPFIGSLAPLPTQLGRRFDQGLFPVDQNTTLAITRGIGESGPRARLFAPPEILLLKSRNTVDNKTETDRPGL